MSYEVTCPRCDKSLMTHDAEGIHLLTRHTIFKRDGTVEGVCPQCKHRVPVPIKLAPTVKHVINVEARTG